MKNLAEKTPLSSPSCAFCGSGKVRSRAEEVRFAYVTGSETVELPAVAHVHTCGACGSEFADDSLEDAKHEAVCRYLGVLAPTQIRALRGNAKLSRAEFASLTGLGPATVARWERGELIQNIANDRYLRLLGHPENVARLQHFANQVPSPTVVDISRFRALREVSDKERETARAFKLRV